MLEIASVIVIGTLSIFVGFYTTYYLVCWYFKRRTSLNRRTKTVDIYPKVSIIIPLYNEIKVLPRRIENLKEINYPKSKLEIVFVDGGSTDGSIEFLKEYEANELSITNVFQGSRKGFNNAVREGFAHTTGDIICITGAETEYDPQALSLMVQHLSNPEIGTVTGRQRIKNENNSFSPKLEVAYRELYDFVREAESNIDSPFDIKGEITIARRNIIKALVENPRLETRGCIDCCPNFQGRLDGYKTIYEPNAVYYETSPKFIRDSFKQQTRRAATLIENMLTFKEMIFKREFGAFGLFIMPSHLLMLVVLPYFLVFSSIGIITLTVLHPSNLGFLTLLFISLLSIAISRRVKAFLKTQFALIAATLKLLKGVETQKFERLESARP